MRGTTRKPPWGVQQQQLEGPEAPPPAPSAMKTAPKRMVRKRKVPKDQKEATIAALVEVASAAIWLYRKVMPLIRELKQKKGKNERKSRTKPTNDK